MFVTLDPWVNSFLVIRSDQSLSRVQLIEDPMNCSTPDLPVHHQLPEFTQTQVHQVSDAIEPSHPLSSPSSPAPSPSQHQSFPMSQLFTWGGQSTGVSALASFLPKNTQDWSPLEWAGWISLQRHHFADKGLYSQSCSFPISRVWMLNLDHKRLSAELMLLNCGCGEESWMPWTAVGSNKSILKEINPEYSLEGLMLKLKLQYFGHLMQRTDSLENTLMLGKIEGRRRVW